MTLRLDSLLRLVYLESAMSSFPLSIAFCSFKSSIMKRNPESCSSIHASFSGFSATSMVPLNDIGVKPPPATSSSGIPSSFLSMTTSKRSFMIERICCAFVTCVLDSKAVVSYALVNNPSSPLISSLSSHTGEPDNPSNS